jgi:hypothetical protein
MPIVVASGITSQYTVRNSPIKGEIVMNYDFAERVNLMQSPP